MHYYKYTEANFISSKYIHIDEPWGALSCIVHVFQYNFHKPLKSNTQRSFAVCKKHLQGKLLSVIKIKSSNCLYENEDGI